MPPNYIPKCGINQSQLLLQDQPLVESAYQESPPADVWSLVIPEELCRVLELSLVEWGPDYPVAQVGFLDYRLVEVPEWEARP